MAPTTREEGSRTLGAALPTWLPCQPGLPSVAAQGPAGARPARSPAPGRSGDALIPPAGSRGAGTTSVHPCPASADARLEIKHEGLYFGRESWH